MPEIHDFIVRRTKEDFSSDAAQYFYCHSILEGMVQAQRNFQFFLNFFQKFLFLGTFSNNACWVKNRKIYGKRIEKVRRFRKVIKEDIGEEFWQEKLKPAFDGMILKVLPHIEK